MASVILPRRPIRRESMSQSLTVFVAILLALSPGVFFSFGYHNDYNAWGYNAQSCCNHHPETSILFAIGRYFGAIAQNLQFLTIRTIDDLWGWRLIGLVSAALLGVYYFYIVSLGKSPSWRDAFLTVAVFVLPTMQFEALWVSMYMFWAPPFLCALIGFHLLLATIGSRILLGPLLAFLALLTGVFFYPASTTLVLVPAAHLLVTENTWRARRLAVITSIALGSAFVALFVIHKFAVLPRLSHVPYLGEYEFNISQDLIGTALYKLQIHLVDGSNLWLGFELWWFPIAFGLICLRPSAYLSSYRLALPATHLINGTWQPVCSWWLRRGDRGAAATVTFRITRR